MFDIVKTKLTVKIKKDFCTVFAMFVGLSHAWCGGKITGRSGLGVMVKCVVAASGADRYKVITKEPVLWGTRNAFTSIITELLLTKDQLVIKKKTSCFEPTLSFTLTEIAYNRVYCHTSCSFLLI